MVSPCIICGLALCKCRLVAPLIKCGSISLGEDDDLLLLEPCAKDVVCDPNWRKYEERKRGCLISIGNIHDKGEESKNSVKLCNVICTWPLSWTDVTLTRLCLRRILLTCICWFFCNKRASSFESTHWGFFHFSFNLLDLHMSNLQKWEEETIIYSLWYHRHHIHPTHGIVNLITSKWMLTSPGLMTLTHLALDDCRGNGFLGKWRGEGRIFFGGRGKTIKRHRLWLMCLGAPIHASYHFHAPRLKVSFERKMIQNMHMA